jgi:hypothetical protein
MRDREMTRSVDGDVFRVTSRLRAARGFASPSAGVAAMTATNATWSTLEVGGVVGSGVGVVCEQLHSRGESDPSGLAEA